MYHDVRIQIEMERMHGPICCLTLSFSGRGQYAREGHLFSGL